MGRLSITSYKQLTTRTNFNGFLEIYGWPQCCPYRSLNYMNAVRRYARRNVRPKTVLLATNFVVHQIKCLYFKLSSVAFLFVLLSEWFGLTILASFASRQFGIFSFFSTFCMMAFLYRFSRDELWQNWWPIVTVMFLLLSTASILWLLFGLTGVIWGILWQACNNWVDIMLTNRGPIPPSCCILAWSFALPPFRRSEYDSGGQRIWFRSPSVLSTYYA